MISEIHMHITCNRPTEIKLILKTDLQQNINDYHVRTNTAVMNRDNCN